MILLIFGVVLNIHQQHPDHNIGEYNGAKSTEKHRITMLSHRINKAYYSPEPNSHWIQFNFISFNTCLQIFLFFVIPNRGFALAKTDGTPNGLAYATLQNSPCGGTGVIPPFCCGSNTMVHGLDSRESQEKIKTPKTVFFIFWHSQWESNPCCRNENPMSWTARRWEHSFIATQRYPMFGKMSTLFAAFFI